MNHKDFPIVNATCENCSDVEDVRDYGDIEGIEYPCDTFRYLCDKCKDYLDDEFSGEGYDPMHPNESFDEFMDHEDFELD